MIKEKVRKLNYDDFVAQVKEDKFKVEEISYNNLIHDMQYARMMHPRTKKDADRFNVTSVQDLFNELCAEHKEIIDIHTYLEEYMNRVEEALEDSDKIQSLQSEEIEVYRIIMRLRGYSAYKSNLAEISFKLVVQNILNEKYEVKMSDDLDRILAVDLAVLSRDEDVAHYVHVTKDSQFAHEKLKRKSGQVVTVLDSREIDFFNSDGTTQYYRNTKGHVLALYDDKGKNNHIINGVYIFKDDYVRELLEENYGECDKSQYEELKYIRRSKRQTRKRGFGTVSWIED
ncbi:hypothetical protein [Salinicoccus halitifaciens]|uniref:Uncharacterized protein n=1 Tax=Salinicoccus halitifaciens TaxID=1073415 RepID=A0ABV2E7M6_9STAP|nr:hypothetical protein [Salinicoccus halitifaciens]MCD2137190.1 hypothetical protein [Salinicoccus halitifaciens]